MPSLGPMEARKGAGNGTTRSPPKNAPWQASRPGRFCAAPRRCGYPGPCDSTLPRWCCSSDCLRPAGLVLSLCRCASSRSACQVGQGQLSRDTRLPACGGCASCELRSDGAQVFDIHVETPSFGKITSCISSQPPKSAAMSSTFHKLRLSLFITSRVA